MDNLGRLWDTFFNERTKNLFERFTGRHRALVVETNDPLNMYRIRFIIPEMHDLNLKDTPEKCPWAIPSPEFGAKRGGRWGYPCIGDIVFIEFENNHPYSPVYVGYASPTRRKYYALPSIYTQTPLPVDDKSLPGELPEDYQKDYLPLDGRPMSHGWQDRYGHLDIHDATGFFPQEHDVEPPPPELDPVTAFSDDVSDRSKRDPKSEFKSAVEKPKQNTPDSKFMARITKYGQMLIQSDMGYLWKSDDADGSEAAKDTTSDGEFHGDFDKDEKFEIARWFYLQKLIHENHPKDWDQRRLEFKNRYGSSLEFRDVGWNKTRPGEYLDEARFISWDYKSEHYADERWVKLRSKGGSFLEISDIGSDPENDEFIKRKLIDEVPSGPSDSTGNPMQSRKYIDNENEIISENQGDARFIRLVSRSGLKFVLDDCGSHTRKASDSGNNNALIGIGALIKGRRTPSSKCNEEDGPSQDNYPPSLSSSRWQKSDSKKGQSGDPIGYFWQFDERPDHNSTTWGSPLGAAIEISDREQYITICSRLPSLPTKWKYTSKHEFLEKHMVDFNVARDTHHIVIDHYKEAMLFKSRAGNGEGPQLGSKCTDYEDPFVGINQGLEIHDSPEDDPWMELVDAEGRGLWFSKKESLSVWRSKDDKEIQIWIDDSENTIVVRNNELGKIQVYCRGNIEIIADQTIAVHGHNVNIKATSAIDMQVGGAQYSFTQNGLYTNQGIHASEIRGRLPEVPSGYRDSQGGNCATTGTGIGTASSFSGKTLSNLNIETKDKVVPDNRL